MSVLKMAWRNIWRNRRRSLVTIAAMTVALWVMVNYSGLVQGYLVSMERNIIDLEMGDIQIFAPGFRDRPSLYDRIEDPERLVRELEAAGCVAAARTLASGLAAGEQSSAGVLLRGVEVVRDGPVSAVWQRLAAGRWLDADDPQGVVLGRRLAPILDVVPGDEIVILAQAADGSMANELFTVRGILSGVGEGTDRAGVFMNSATLRELMVLPEGAHQIIVRRPQGADLKQTTETVRRLAAGLDVQTWRQLVPTLADLLDNSRGAVAVMFLLVFVAIGIVILNAMLMAVFERIRELGVLKAVGMSPALVMAMMLTETVLMCALAMAAGLALSVPSLIYLASTGIDVGAMGGSSVAGIAIDPVWRAEITAATFSGPVTTFLVVVFAAVLYPSLKAARLRPVEAIRYQ